MLVMLTGVRQVACDGPSSHRRMHLRVASGIAIHEWIIYGLHLASCSSLLWASLYWWIKCPDKGTAYASLFPYIVASTITAMAAVGLFVVNEIGHGDSNLIGNLGQLLVSDYGGYALVPMPVIFTALPVTGLIPIIGKRPGWMALVAILSSLPVGWLALSLIGTAV